MFCDLMAADGREMHADKTTLRDFGVSEMGDVARALPLGFDLTFTSVLEILFCDLFILGWRF